MRHAHTPQSTNVVRESPATASPRIHLAGSAVIPSVLSAASESQRRPAMRWGPEEPPLRGHAASRVSSSGRRWTKTPPRLPRVTRIASERCVTWRGVARS